MTLSEESRKATSESKGANQIPSGPTPAEVHARSHGWPTQTRVSIAKTYTFEASHSLPGYNGPCERLHGHSYVLEVEVTGLVFYKEGHQDDGMVLDFAVLDHIVDLAIVCKVDHTNLNDVLPFRTTAENMVCHFAKELDRAFIAAEIDVQLTQLTLWETAKGRAIWRA